MFNKYKQKKHICLQGNIFLVIFESDLYVYALSGH